MSGLYVRNFKFNLFINFFNSSPCSGSADIKTLLPVETSRFMSISSEFLTLMKKVSKSPMVIDVLNIQGVQRRYRG